MMPLIGLSADLQPDDEQAYHAAGERYVQALATACACLPVIIPSHDEPALIDAVLDRLDGIVLTGAVSNVHPECYGAEPTDEHAPFDRDRDRVTLPLARRAIDKGLALLAICRGFQELNVAYGGSLHPAVHALEGRLDHRAQGPDWDACYTRCHRVSLTPGGCLAEWAGTTTVDVNTLHRQGVDRLGSGLIVEARADDGTVEAVRVESASGFALGVQWHPEYRVMDNSFSRQIFEAFANAARRYAAGKVR